MSTMNEKQDPLRAIRQYDRGLEDDVSAILRVIERADAHLDANTAQAYRDQPLAGHWSRITKVCSEAGEVMDALSACTGENPRKGVHGTWDELTEELADTACAALFAIQHVTKNSGVTWGIFLNALAKAEGRVTAAGAIYHPDPEINAEVAADAAEAEIADLAAGYPPRRWRCPDCGTEHDRGHFMSVGIHRCLACGYNGTCGIMLDAGQLP